MKTDMEKELMGKQVVLGVDIGTSSSKGVLVTFDGRILRSAVRAHSVERPFPGHVEMSAEIWWQEFVDIATELTAPSDVDVVSVGVSGMGPCVLVTDERSRPLRPAILYGVDTRAMAQIDALNAALDPAKILDRCGSALSSQAVGPKLAWLREHEPAVYAQAKRLYMPSSWLAYKLTGNYVLDYHSASQCTPMFDTRSLNWYLPWVDLIAPGLELPPLRWPGEQAGVTAHPVAGIAAGVPVITGTIDAWSEALSVGAHNVGDLMLMYGTTMFLINTVQAPITSASMWGTVGALEGTRSLAGGMATSGAITAWLRELVGSPDYATLLAEADTSGPGANGLLLLPYFAGERTPIMDPEARGVLAGLTLTHNRGDVYRAVLEAVAFGVRHNIDVMRSAGAVIDRVVAVGGGTQGGLWTQIVTNVTGMTQIVPSKTIGASYGVALLAAQLEHDVCIDDWNPPARVVTPEESPSFDYDDLYRLYLDLYPASREIVHALAAYASRPSRRPTTGPDPFVAGEAGQHE
jgi:xylulokinase